MTTNNEFNAESGDDARIDAQARAAGSALRHPAPADGLSRVTRARRNRQIGRIGAVTAVVAVLGIAGAVWRLNGSSTDVPPATESTSAETTVALVTTTTTVTTEEPSTSNSPATQAPTVPTTTSGVVPSDAPDPGLLYEGTDELGMQSVIDARTGVVLRTEPVDDEKAAAYLPQYVPPRVDNAAGTYRFELLLNTPAAMDGCGQSPLNIFPMIEGTPAGDVRTVPTYAAIGRLTPDGRVLIVAAAPCLENDTPAASRTTTIERFPADGPSTTGEVLGTITTIGQSFWTSGFDGSGRYLFVSAFGPGDPSKWVGTVAVFDLRTGEEVDVLGGCVPSAAPELRTAAGSSWGFVPQQFVSGSTLAYTAACPDGSQHAVIVDVARPDARVDLVIPGAVAGDRTTIELDRSGLADPTSAWFVVRVTDPSGENRRAFVGQGAQPLRPLDGITDPTFQPLWSPGG